jgi:anti-sigma B factor antagonist
LSTDPERLFIRFRRLPGGAALIQLAGFAESDEVEALERLVEHALAEGFESLIVDLSRLVSIDGQFLGLLVRALRRVRPVGGDVVLVVKEGPVSRLLETTGMRRAFSVAATLEEARRRLPSSELWRGDEAGGPGVPPVVSERRRGERRSGLERRRQQGWAGPERRQKGRRTARERRIST